MYRVICPCCKGKKWLIMHGAGIGVDIEHAYSCTHCQGDGEISAEVSDDPFVIGSDGDGPGVLHRCVPRFVSDEGS